VARCLDGDLNVVSLSKAQSLNDITCRTHIHCVRRKVTNLPSIQIAKLISTSLLRETHWIGSKLCECTDICAHTSIERIWRIGEVHIVHKSGTTGEDRRQFPLPYVIFRPLVRADKVVYNRNVLVGVSVSRGAAWDVAAGRSGRWIR
jgi:hypothetical protein